MISIEIGKDRMRKAFLEKYPDKHVTVLQVMTSLRDKGLIYNSKYRCDNVQGCYVGVKFATDDECDDEEYEKGIDKKEQAIDAMMFLKNENGELKKQIENLKAQLNQEPKDEKPKKVKKPKSTPTDDFKDVANEMMELI